MVLVPNLWWVRSYELVDQQPKKKKKNFSSNPDRFQVYMDGRLKIGIMCIRNIMVLLRSQTYR